MMRVCPRAAGGGGSAFFLFAKARIFFEGELRSPNGSDQRLPAAFFS